VLVHGAWHDATCWQPLVPFLEKSGHQVHTPDLPGQGKNSADPASISLKTYSRYISQFIDKIENNVILVGHSMSGMVISQVAEALPDRLDRLLFLSAYLPGDGQSLFDLIAANRGDEPPTAIESAMTLSPDKRTCTIEPDQIAPLFYNRCPNDKRNLVPISFIPQASLPLSGKVQLTEENFGRVPKTYLCCLDDRVIPIHHQRRMMNRQRCDEMVQLDADHSPFLSCPKTLAAALHCITLTDCAL
jgi:pimeloyl-ACP methyl ester carboxylesterase